MTAPDDRDDAEAGVLVFQVLCSVEPISDEDGGPATLFSREDAESLTTLIADALRAAREQGRRDGVKRAAECLCSVLDCDECRPCKTDRRKMERLRAKLGGG